MLHLEVFRIPEKCILSEKNICLDFRRMEKGTYERKPSPVVEGTRIMTSFWRNSKYISLQ